MLGTWSPSAGPGQRWGSSEELVRPVGGVEERVDGNWKAVLTLFTISKVVGPVSVLACRKVARKHL